jgi:glycosyltransferase involved in cell wall biosynthesis
LVDLIVATIGRCEELCRFFESAAVQTCPRFRVLVVDQNVDDRLEDVLERYAPALEICHLRAEPGLSRARNVGLAYVSSDLVAFPDDDCWYPPDLVARVVERFDAYPELDGLSARCTDSDGRPSTMLWDRDAGKIDRFNVWRRAISTSVFLRKPLIEAVGRFREDLGAGSGTEYGSGEESDYLLRALDAGFELRYDPSLEVHHESPRPDFTRTSRAKAYRSGKGHGHVLRRHGYPVWFAAYRVAQLLAGASLFLATGRPAQARFYFVMALGRVVGWMRS